MQTKTRGIDTELETDKPSDRDGGQREPGAKSLTDLETGTG